MLGETAHSSRATEFTLPNPVLPSDLYLLIPKEFKIIWFSNFVIMSVPDKFSFLFLYTCPFTFEHCIAVLLY